MNGDKHLLDFVDYLFMMMYFYQFATDKVFIYILFKCIDAIYPSPEPHPHPHIYIQHPCIQNIIFI